MVKQCGLIVHPDESWIGGSPDGLDALSGVILEIKCPGSADMSQDEIMNTLNVKKYVQCINEDCFALRRHHTYYCQVQVNMWILNCQTQIL